MRPQLGLACCWLICVTACGGTADFAPAPAEAAGASSAGAPAGVAGTSAVTVEAAGASSAGGAPTGAGGASAGTGGAAVGTGGEAGATPIEENSCSDAPAVIGCGCPMNPNPPPEVWSCIECTTLPSTSALIGPEGGSFVLRGQDDQVFQLTIPPNALAAPTKIRVSESVRAPVSLLPASDGYSIEPKGIEFAVPAFVTVPVSQGKAGTGLYWSPDTCSEPVWVKGNVPAADSVSGTITHTGVVFATALVALN